MSMLIRDPMRTYADNADFLQGDHSPTQEKGYPALTHPFLGEHSTSTHLCEGQSGLAIPQGDHSPDTGENIPTHSPP